MNLDEVGPGKLSIYLTAGHPDLDASFAHMDAAIQGGAHWLEIGFPFSDPAADGPVIEAAANSALSRGTTTAECLALGQRLRAVHPDVPLVAMTYANVAYQLGWDEWAKALATHGYTACILPDVPLEESEPVRSALAAHGLQWVPLVTPTTSKQRMASIAETATGFLYVVSNTGITGQADPGKLLEATVERARSVTDKPLCVGFGIASAQDVLRVWDAGCGAIVGSHVVKGILDGGGPEQTRRRVAALLPSQS